MKDFIEGPVYSSFLNLWMFRINEWSKLPKTHIRLNTIPLSMQSTMLILLDRINGVFLPIKATGVAFYVHMLAAQLEVQRTSCQLW